VSNQLIENLLRTGYSIYFALTSLRPFGAIDWAVRGALGRWFNDATTSADIEMVRCLGKHRADDSGNVFGFGEISDSHLPNIDILVLSSERRLPMSRLLSGLEGQSYPPEKLTLTVITAEDTASWAASHLPKGLRSVRLEVVPDRSMHLGYQTVLDELTAPLALLISHCRIPARSCLRRAVSHALQDSDQVAVWDLSPTLAERSRYCDPVCLDVPHSGITFSLVRPSALRSAGGFDDRFPVTGQGLELSYRLRQLGYRLRCIGRRSDFTDHHGSPQPPTEIADPSTLFALRDLYGNWLLRLFNPMLFSMQRRQLGTSGAVARRSKLTRRAPAQVRSIGATPSRLWSGEYEIGVGGPAPTASDSNIDPSLVSIIIRTYAGRGAWLRQSIRSVLNQTHDPLQLVVVEDGSEEHRGYIEDLQTKLAELRPITYLSQRKLGKSAAGNRGLEAARGQLIGFLDDDDLLMPDHVEALHQTIRSADGAAGAYALAWDAHTEPLQPAGYREVYMEVPQRYRVEFDYDKLLSFNYLPIQSVLFDRRLYETYGGFENDRQYLEDWDLWLRYTRNDRFVHLPRVTSIYRTPADPYARIARVRKRERRAAPLS